MRKTVLLILISMMLVHQVQACEIEGTWQLKSDTKHLTLNFNPEGVATIIAGTKNGPFTGITTQWLYENGTLKLVSTEGEIIVLLSDIERSGNVVSAKNKQGDVEYYLYTAPNK